MTKHLHCSETNCKVLVEFLRKERDPARIEFLVADYLTKRKNISLHIRRIFDQQVLEIVDSPELARRIQVDQYKESNGERTHPADVGIVVITPRELKMAQLAFAIPSEARPQVIRNDRYWMTTIPSLESRRALRIVLTMVGEQRNSECSAAVTRLRGNFSIESCALVGICGGLRDKVRLDDVIFASHILDYEGGRLESGGLKKRYEVLRPPRSSRADWSHFEATDFGGMNLCSQGNGMPKDLLPKDPSSFDSKFNIYSGIIASGEKLVVNGMLTEIQQDHDQRILGCDMEGSGFGTACEFSPSLKWFVFRGVSDYGEPKNSKVSKSVKGDDHQHLAAYNAATVARYFFELGYRAEETKEF